MEERSNECSCGLNEIEFFDPIEKQLDLDSAREMKISSSTSIATEEGTIEFTIAPSMDELIDLNDTELTITAKVVNAAADAKLLATDVIAP